MTVFAGVLSSTCSGPAGPAAAPARTQKPAITNPSGAVAWADDDRWFSSTRASAAGQSPASGTTVSAAAGAANPPIPATSPASRARDAATAAPLTTVFSFGMGDATAH